MFLKENLIYTKYQGNIAFSHFFWGQLIPQLTPMLRTVVFKFIIGHKIHLY